MTHFARHPADDLDHEPDCDCGDCSERRAEATPSPEEDRRLTLAEAEVSLRAEADMIQRCDCGCGQAVLRGVNNVVILDDSSFRFATVVCHSAWARRTFTEATS